MKFKSNNTKDITLRGKKITISPRTIGDKMRFLNYIQKNENFNMSTLMDLVIKPIVVNKEDLPKVLELPEIDYILKNSKCITNCNTDYNYQCSNCYETNNIKVNLNEYIIKLPTFDKGVYKNNIENLFITFTFAKSLKVMDTIFENEDLETLFIDDLINHIKTINYNNVDLKENEFKEFLESLPEEIFNDIKKEYDKHQGESYYKNKHYCKECKTPNNIEINSLLEVLLW